LISGFSGSAIRTDLDISIGCRFANKIPGRWV
jgi:hypothetical protein